jgi:hypothetical protein
MDDEVLVSARAAQHRATELRERAERTIAAAEVVAASVRTGFVPEVAELRREVEGLRLALETRAVIEQAKGVVMATTGCDVDEAFHFLVRRSQRENRKLREIAEELVSRAASGLHRTSADPRGVMDGHQHDHAVDGAGRRSER